MKIRAAQNLRFGLLSLGFLIRFATPVFAEDLIERLSADSSEKPVSAQVSLLFEEKKKNDEEVEVQAPPRVESRDATLQELSKDHWEIAVHLREGDREKHPMMTCIIATEGGSPLVLPNRVLGTAEDAQRNSNMMGAFECLHDPNILSPDEIAALTNEERTAFIRSREDDSKKFAAEINSILTDKLGERLFTEEQKFGLAPSAPLSRKLTVEEIARRLVALESVWSGPKK